VDVPSRHVLTSTMQAATLHGKSIGTGADIAPGQSPAAHTEKVASVSSLVKPWTVREQDAHHEQDAGCAGKIGANCDLPCSHASLLWQSTSQQIGHPHTSS
jgi:hypothetical protein